MWTIWRQRNNRVFEGFERPTMDLKLILLRSLVEWMAVLPRHSCSSLPEFIDCCNFSLF
jgi:hypothetical protein